LGFLERLVFWILHVGIGLACFYIASWILLPRALTLLPNWLALLLAGIAAAVLLVPLTVWVENSLPASLRPVEDDFWLVGFAGQGLWQQMLVEFLEVAPVIVTIWMLINLPFLTSKPELIDPPDVSPGNEPGERGSVEKQEANDYAQMMQDKFLDSLPKSIGTNVLAMSSDLHYLHVHTELGRCMILGSLQRATEAMGKDGLRVHRGHWVARKAVVKIVKDGQQWHCVLNNGLKIPVSRRNKSLVASWFGQNAKVLKMSAGKQSAAGQS
jgi:hypothetical protein